MHLVGSFLRMTGVYIYQAAGTKHAALNRYGGYFIYEARFF